MATRRESPCRVPRAAADGRSQLSLYVNEGRDESVHLCRFQSVRVRSVISRARPAALTPPPALRPVRFKVFTRLQLCVKRQEPELAERPREGTNSQLKRSFLTRLHLIYPSQLSIEREREREIKNAVLTCRSSLRSRVCAVSQILTRNQESERIILTQ